MRLSVVIPCFNEESVIDDCLSAVAEQTRLPDEVIVVDNNSSDRTAEIAACYADRLPVRLIKEPRQGVAWASQAGYDSATGDVIARVDADTHADPQWSSRISSFLESHPEVDGVRGALWFYDIPKNNMRGRVVADAERFGSDSSGATSLLNGGNMAIRRAAWIRARPFVKNIPGTHEDIDVSYALGDAGCVLHDLPGMVAATSARRFATSQLNIVRYARAVIRTQIVHRRWKHAVAYLLGLPFNFGCVAFWSYQARQELSARPSPVTE